MAECPTCGDTFDTDQGMKVHHATVHDERIGSSEVPCTICGTVVERYESRIKKHKNIFCSPECRHEWVSENQSGVDHHQYNQVDRECKQCGDSFTEIPSRIENGRGKFCSRDCYGAWLSENNVGKDHHMAKGELVECAWCGGELFRSPSRVGDRSFCSMECQGKWRRENTPTGEDHPNHNGGKPQYGPGWNERKRRKVRMRDGFECQDCYMSQESHKDEYGIRLDVHHIKKAKEFTDPEKRNAMDNLVTLCRSCHLGKWEKMAPLSPNTD